MGKLTDDDLREHASGQGSTAEMAMELLHHRARLALIAGCAPKYESLGNGDLTPEQLDGMDQWDRDVMLDERHRVVGSMLVRRAVAEIRRHRATRSI